MLRLPRFPANLTIYPPPPFSPPVPAALCPTPVACNLSSPLPSSAPFQEPRQVRHMLCIWSFLLLLPRLSASPFSAHSLVLFSYPSRQFSGFVLRQLRSLSAPGGPLSEGEFSIVCGLGHRQLGKLGRACADRLSF